MLAVRLGYMCPGDVLSSNLIIIDIINNAFENGYIRLQC